MNLKFNKVVDSKLTSAYITNFLSWFDFTAQTNLGTAIEYFSI